MHPTEGNLSRGNASSWSYFLTQWKAYLWYMRLWFWPRDLNADYATLTFSQTFFELGVALAGLGNLALIGLSWRLRRKTPALLFGLIWFYVTISPASSVVVLAEAMNEHRMYLAYFGFAGAVYSVFLLCAKSLLNSPRLRWGGGLAYILVLLVLAVSTQVRNRVWANDESLWQDTVEKNPTSGRALNNLALVYMERSDYKKAIEYFEQCQTYWDTYLYCPLNLGISHFALGEIAKSQGDPKTAEAEYRKALEGFERAYRLNPESVHTNFFLGRMSQDLKMDYAQAIRYYVRSIELTGGRYTDVKSGWRLVTGN